MSRFQHAASLGELAIQFGIELVGDPAAKVSRVATLANADSQSLSFFANKAYREHERGGRSRASGRCERLSGQCLACR
jgi:UDP-3-O-[3-hydroxymyristoyl] glucosamine N-acyltransferase